MTAEEIRAKLESSRHSQMGSAMIQAFDTFTGKPTGQWVEYTIASALIYAAFEAGLLASSPNGDKESA